MTNRIAVYDSKNTSRLLGTVSPSLVESHRYATSFRVALMERMPMPFRWGDDYDFTRPVNYFVEFDWLIESETHRVQVDWATEVETTTRTKVLKTSAPLDRLMMIPQFRLPGEDAEAAEIRRELY